MYFFFNDTAPTEIYTYRHTLSLHDALPILSKPPLSFLTRSYLPHGTAALRLTLSSPAISRRGVMPDRRTGGPCAIMFMPPFGAQVSDPTVDRKSVVEGTSVSVRVDLGGRRIIKKKKQK